MPFKMTGAEFKRFWNDEAIFQGGKFYVDDDAYLVDEKPVDGCDLDPVSLADNAKLVVESGVLVSSGDNESTDLIARIRRWRKETAMVTVAVECLKEREAELRALLATHKFKAL